MIDITHVSANIGRYIRFEGSGVIDGLVQPKTKASFYKIIGADSDKVTVRMYRRRALSFLPSYNFNQGYEIITGKEFKSLPMYG